MQHQNLKRKACASACALALATLSFTGAEVAAAPGVRQVGLILRNTSALPFRVKRVDGPAWLQGGGGLVRPEAITGMVLNVDREAPAGAHRVELEFEVSNFHTGPGSNLRVKVPLGVMVAR